MGCVRAGEVVKGEQLIASQGQETPRARRLVLQVSKEAGDRSKGWQVERASNEKQGPGLTRAIS